MSWRQVLLYKGVRWRQVLLYYKGVRWRQVLLYYKGVRWKQVLLYYKGVRSRQVLLYYKGDGVIHKGPFHLLLMVLLSSCHVQWHLYRESDHIDIYSISSSAMRRYYSKSTDNPMRGQPLIRDLFLDYSVLSSSC